MNGLICHPSLGLGIIAGLTRDRLPDLLLSTISLIGMSLPEFVTATLLIYLFSIKLRLFPAVTLVNIDVPLSKLLPNNGYRRFNSGAWLPLWRGRDSDRAGHNARLCGPRFCAGRPMPWGRRGARSSSENCCPMRWIFCWWRARCAGRGCCSPLAHFRFSALG